MLRADVSGFGRGSHPSSRLCCSPDRLLKKKRKNFLFFTFFLHDLADKPTLKRNAGCLIVASKSIARLEITADDDLVEHLFDCFAVDRIVLDLFDQQISLVIFESIVSTRKNVVFGFARQQPKKNKKH